MSDRRLGVVAALAALSIVPLGGTRSTFVPDWTFKGSTLAGWHVLGAAEWKAVDGELVGTPKSTDGGWLVLDKSFQDVEFGADFKCVSGCRTGVLLRAEKTPTGMKGVFLSLDDGDVGGYAVTLDANGKILTRERLRPGGGLMRVAPSAADAAAAAAARGRGAAGVLVAALRARWRPGTWRPRARCAALGRGAAQPDGAVRPQAERLERRRCRHRRQHHAPWVNTSASGGGAADDDLGTFGPIAIYVGGSGQVHFRDVSYRDLSLKRVIKEELSPNYQMLRLTPFYYSFASGAADFDRDGNMDIVSGPFIFLGPDFTKVREFYMALTTNPSTSFSSNWLEFAGDFTGDGWPDVLLASTSGTRLYVNPKGEPRRWDSYAASRAAGAQRLGSVGDEGHRRRWQARSRVRKRGRGAMGEARSGQPDRTLALDAGWRSRHLRRAWHRRRRHQRRWPRRHPQRLRMVGAAREGRDRDVDVSSLSRSAVRTAAEHPAAPRCACTTSMATSSTTS